MRPSRSRESGWRHPGNHEQRLRTARASARRGRAGRGDWIGPRSIMGRSGHRHALEPKLEHGYGGAYDSFRILPAQEPGRWRMTTLRAAAGRLLIRLLAAVGLIVVFA